MRLTQFLAGNLNRRHWNRRAWQVGYRGPVLAQQKATGRPDYPVSNANTNLVRERLQREWSTMERLAVPAYYSKDQKSAWLAQLGHASLTDLEAAERLKQDQRRMPGKPKDMSGSLQKFKRNANVGNMLHAHRTVEDQLQDLLPRRWD